MLIGNKCFVFRSMWRNTQHFNMICFEILNWFVRSKTI